VGAGGGRTSFTSMNVAPTIPMNIGEQSFLKLKALVMIAPAKTAER
jgi:hypothetical protein